MLLMCREVPLSANTEAAAAGLGVVCGFYLKLSENKLLSVPVSPPVSSPNQSPHVQHNYPREYVYKHYICKIESISPF